MDLSRNSVHNRGIYVSGIPIETPIAPTNKNMFEPRPETQLESVLELSMLRVTPRACRGSYCREWGVVAGSVLLCNSKIWCYYEGENAKTESIVSRGPVFVILLWCPWGSRKTSILYNKLQVSWEPCPRTQFTSVLELYWLPACKRVHAALLMLSCLLVLPVLCYFSLSWLCL